MIWSTASSDLTVNDAGKARADDWRDFFKKNRQDRQGENVGKTGELVHRGINIQQVLKVRSKDGYVSTCFNGGDDIGSYTEDKSDK